ncbi:LuxR C-terminal-related transcriptional regulator [Nocardioides sambongensis]|uniref:LuxR C-terminal-related transcriptional regulator n=1 Tax=Nocardioides sambongensis TaxID=2589074 RepID=UPI0018C8B0BD|nr:LuxR C-terminal-related transcriptional regulator [Nocardioides sambongensis]
MDTAPRTCGPHSSPGMLNADDLRLLRYLARGYDGRRLARELGFSEATVQRRVAGVRERLGARTTIQAVVIALRAHLI